MNISGPFIRRPVMTILVMVTILFFGVLSYFRLPVNALPSIDYPVITINTSYPGADATVMANNVATPIEQECMQIDGLQSIISSNYSGTSMIVAVFDIGKSLTSASNDISAAINRASANLPSDLPSQPTYQNYNPSNSPILYLALTSESLTEGDMYNYANINFGERINMISGVSKIQVYGSKYAVRAKVDAPSLFAKGIGIDQVAQTLQLANQNLPGGYLYDQFKRRDLLPQGKITSAEEYKKLILSYQDNTSVKIENIADVVDSTEAENMYFTYWNKKDGSKPSVVLAILKQSAANTVAITQKIKDLLPTLKTSVPPSIDVNIIYASADGIMESINEVETTLFEAFILVAIVILFFLGSVRTMIIPVIALPLSIIGTFVFLYICGYSLDILSLLALTLVVGFLVDDAIVVLENIFRHIEMGKDPMQAGLDGSKQISTTVFSMTICLVIVFLPMVFMPGIMGLMFRELSWTIVVAVLISGVVSLTLTPMMCSRIFKKQRKESFLEKVSNKLFKVLLGLYLPILRWCMHWRMVPLIIGGAFIVLSGVLFTLIPQDFIPTGGTGALMGVAQCKEGTSPVAQSEYMDQLMVKISENSSVENIVGIINTDGFTAPNQGRFFANLTSLDQRESTEIILEEINASIEPISGIAGFIQEMPLINLNVGTSQSKTAYEYTLSTLTDLEELYASATKLMDEMRNFPDIFSGVTSDMQVENPQYSLEILRNQASIRGVSTQAIEQALTYAFAEGKLMSIVDTEDQYRFIIQLEGKYRTNEKSLEGIYVSSTSGELVPLEMLIEVKETLGPLTVNHINQFTSVKVGYNLASGAALGEATNKITEIANSVIPVGVSHFSTGTSEVFKETIIAIQILLILGIVVIYVVLGILYESFIIPLTVLSALPGAAFGALLTLFIFGDTLSIYSYIGIIMLIGIVMKNGIMLVEFAMEHILEGKTPMEAILHSCEERFRPIIMTTIAAGMGVVPIAIGAGSAAAEQRRPLGMTIIGGLIISQLITFFFTPVIYYYLERFEQWMKGKKTV
jgi:hydrophobic/amphiphilic exporter-1 (mainly G- bacteria), HAE1 family